MCVVETNLYMHLSSILLLLAAYKIKLDPPHFFFVTSQQLMEHTEVLNQRHDEIMMCMPDVG